jgi:hypothetical protein
VSIFPPHWAGGSYAQPSSESCGDGI